MVVELISVVFTFCHFFVWLLPLFALISTDLSVKGKVRLFSNQIFPSSMVDKQSILTARN